MEGLSIKGLWETVAGILLIALLGALNSVGLKTEHVGMCMIQDFKSPPDGYGVKPGEPSENQQYVDPTRMNFKFERFLICDHRGHPAHVEVDEELWKHVHNDKSDEVPLDVTVSRIFRQV